MIQKGLLKLMKEFLYSFFIISSRSVKNFALRMLSVELCRPTALTLSQKLNDAWGMEYLNTRFPFPYPAICRKQCEAKEKVVTESRKKRQRVLPVTK